MFCKKCGKQIREDARFCPYCGTETASGREKPNATNNVKKKKRIWPLIIAFFIIAISVGIGMSYATRRTDNVKKNNNYQALMDEGNKYIEDLDYEKAEDKYLKAISIEPKKKEPYIKLADLYMAQGKQKEATNILKKAVKNVDTEESEEIQQRYDLYTYVDKVLIPKEGQCKEGQYECKYERTSYNGVSVKPLQSEKGVMNWNIMDYDNDGKEELLVLLLKKSEKNSIGIGENQNAVYLQMYALVNGEVTLQDEYWGLYPVLGYGDNENAGIFLITKDKKTYICGSNDEVVCTYATGATIKSFVLTYENNQFVEQAGQTEPMSGSDFMPDETQQKMIEMLTKLGLNKDAAKIKETGKSVFEFQDSVDEILLRIQGKNEGFDADKVYSNATNSIQGYNPDEFGKVVIQIKYGDTTNSSSKETSIDSQSIAESSNSVTSDTYLAEYGPIIDAAYSKYYDGIQVMNYFLCDIDKDGIKELLVQNGTCEADYTYQAYTIQNNKSKYLGEISGFHTMFYKDENGGTEKYIIQVQGYMMGETISHIEINNGKIESEEVSNKQLGQDEEYYSNSYPVESAETTDKSLLQK
ncbi:zinc-ribbon domain-containing protein [Dorea sp.]